MPAVLNNKKPMTSSGVITDSKNCEGSQENVCGKHWRCRQAFAVQNRCDTSTYVSAWLRSKHREDKGYLCLDPPTNVIRTLMNSLMLIAANCDASSNHENPEKQCLCATSDCGTNWNLELAVTHCLHEPEYGIRGFSDLIMRELCGTRFFPHCIYVSQ